MIAGEMQFKRVVHPENFRGIVIPIHFGIRIGFICVLDTSLMGSDFLYREEDYALPLHARHKIFLKTVGSKLKTWDR